KQSPARPIRNRKGRHVLAGEEHASAVGGELARELVDERGLAGAVGADDGVQLAGRDVQRDLVGDQERAVALDQRLRAQQRIQLASPTASRACAGAAGWRSKRCSRPAMPVLPASTMRTMSGPKTAIQCSVKPFSTSSTPRKASAPRSGPKTDPMPPSTIITMRSPDTIQDRLLGEAKAVRFASRSPATPQIMAEMTEGVSW